MCILPGSLEDWETESSPDGALLTSNLILIIAATRADDSHQGGLVPRHAPDIETRDIILNYAIDKASEEGRILNFPYTLGAHYLIRASYESQNFYTVTVVMQ